VAFVQGYSEIAVPRDPIDLIVPGQADRSTTIFTSPSSRGAR
jgi:hypothetical protein